MPMTSRVIIVHGIAHARAAAAAAVGYDAWHWVLGGGEEHALAAVFPGDPPPGWRVIGATVAGPPTVLVDGRPWRASAGWQSY